MDKHTKMWLQMVDIAARASNCPRRKFSALLVNTKQNTLVAHGYNGAPRKGTKLCQSDTDCVRSIQSIPSGHNIELGCIHAEMNAICNAARSGVSTADTTCYCNGAPCLMCAKLLYQAGVTALVTIQNDYSRAGVNFLTSHGVSFAEYPINLLYDE